MQRLSNSPWRRSSFWANASGAFQTFNIDRTMRTLLGSLLLVGSVASCWALTSINPTNKYAYGANIGWSDWRGDTNSGAVIGEYVCSGYIYAANAGWISLGGGTPTNGIYYLNLSANDFGVNQDGLGNLRGHAY